MGQQQNMKKKEGKKGRRWEKAGEREREGGK